MSSRHSTRTAQRVRPKSILADLLLHGDEPRPKAYRRRHPSDPDWEEDEANEKGKKKREDSRASRPRSLPLTKTRAGQRKQEKRDKQRQKRREANELNRLGAGDGPVIPQEQITTKKQTTTRKQAVKKKQTTSKQRSNARPRRNPLEEAVAERLRLEAEEAAAREANLLPDRRPWMTARPVAQRKLIGLLTEDESPPPAPPPPPDNGDVEMEPGADPGNEMGMELAPVQELDPDPRLETDEELGSESGPEPEPDMGFETDQEVDQESEQELDQESEQELEEPQQERKPKPKEQPEEAQEQELEEAGVTPSRKEDRSGGGLRPADAATGDGHHGGETRPESEPMERSTPETGTVTAAAEATTSSAKKVKPAARAKTTAAKAETGSARTVTVGGVARPAGSARTVTIATRARVATAAAEAGTAAAETGAAAAETGAAAAETGAATAETGAAAAEKDPDAVLFGEASGAEGSLAASMMLPLANRRMRCIPSMKQLQVRARNVYQAAAEYRDLVANSDRAPPPAADQQEDFVPPGSCGRRLTVLRQPPPSRTPTDLTALLEDERGSIRETMLPPTTMLQALDVIHELRLQNMRLQTAVLRAGAEPLRDASDAQGEPGKVPPLRRGRGSHKELAMVHATRLRRLEKIEAGMERVFSPAQIAVLCSEDSRGTPRWSEADLRRTVELRAMCSRKVFDFVRGPLGLPMPCINTLQTGCKRYPDLDEELARALGEPAPRCPTCRRNRDDATTEEQRRRYNSPPRPRKRRKKEGVNEARMIKKEVDEAGKKIKKEVDEPRKKTKGGIDAAKKKTKQAVALARRTGTVVGESADRMAPGRRRSSWRFVQDAAEDSPSPSEEPDYWGGDAAEAAAETSETEDSGGEPEEPGRDAEDLIGTVSSAQTRRVFAQRGMWL